MTEEETALESSSPGILAHLAQNHREFLRFLEHRVGNRSDAEEILQQAFVRAVERSGDVRREESSIAWFYRMLRNAVVDHYRRRGANARALELLLNETDVTVPALETREAICSCIRTLSETLKPEYADALRRIEVEGVSVQEYAAHSGISANNAAVRIHRAREALKKRVTASCGTCAEHGCLDCACESSSNVDV